jgi:hypothetical protein
VEYDADLSGLVEVQSMTGEMSNRSSMVRRGEFDVVDVALALNTRPRKTLGWRTPAEALDEHLRSIQQGSVATTG